MNETTRPRRTTTTTAKARALADLGEDKAIVETTTVKSYVEKAPEQSNNNTGNNSILPTSQTFENGNSSPMFAPIQEMDLPLNQPPIIRFMNELKDYITAYDLPRDYVFTAIITRQADQLRDDFKVKCPVTSNFPAMDFSLSNCLEFPELLQKANNNSGGRFRVSVFDNEQQELLPISLFLYVQNPIKEIVTPQTNNDNNTLAMFEKMLQAQREQTERIISVIQSNNRPQEKSTLEQAIEQKILRDILDDKPKENGSFEEKMLTIFAMPQMVEKMANKMFPENVQPTEQSFLEKALNNETLVNNVLDKAGGVVGGIANYLAMKEQAKIMQQQQQNPQAVQNPQPQAVNQPAQLTPQQIEAQQVNEQIQAKQMQNDLTNRIITELESSNPIDANNATLQALKAEYTVFYDAVANMCKTMPFNNLWELLIDNFAPKEITDKFFDENDELNEKGVFLESRLKELYEFWKAD